MVIPSVARSKAMLFSRTRQIFLLVILSVTFVEVEAVRANDVLADKSNLPAVRKFTLEYAVTIRGPQQGANVRVWLPEPQTNEDQKVSVLPGKFPAPTRTETEPQYGNRIT